VPALARRSHGVRCRRSPFFATADLAELFDAVVVGPREIGVNEWADGRTLHKVDTTQQPRGTPEANGDRAAAAFFRFQRRDRVTLRVTPVPGTCRVERAPSAHLPGTRRYTCLCPRLLGTCHSGAWRAWQVPGTASGNGDRAAAAFLSV
jgi:hypothetical protein